jgi:hypothetical protein
MHAAEEADAVLVRQYRGALNALLFYVREINVKAERRADAVASMDPAESNRLAGAFEPPAGISRAYGWHSE